MTRHTTRATHPFRALLVGAALTALTLTGTALLPAAAADAAAAPAVSWVTPPVGSPAGGYAISVYGRNFIWVTAVQFAGTTTRTFRVVSPTGLQVIVPRHTSGLVHVTVRTRYGTSATTRFDLFRYQWPAPPDGQPWHTPAPPPFRGPTPTLTGLVPAAGSTDGYAVIVVHGLVLQPADDVYFGSRRAVHVTYLDPVTLLATVPPAPVAGPVPVRIQTAVGLTASTPAGVFTYVAPPVITGVSPATGPDSGGTTFTITGVRLFDPAGTDPPYVSLIGGVTMVSATPTEIVCITKPDLYADGPQRVLVSTRYGGTSHDSPNNVFTFYRAPGPYRVS